MRAEAIFGAALAFLLVASALAVSGCERGESDTVTLGVAGPMTGALASMGTDMRNSAKMAREKWNAKGGVLGKKVAIEVVDDYADPKQAVTVAGRLVEAEVAGVMGHFNSSCSLPASDVYNEAGIPMISPASTTPQLTEKGYGRVFRVCGRDDQQARIAADFVLEELGGIERVAVIHDKTTYGQGLADEFLKALGDRAEVVFQSGILLGDRDFKTILSAIKDTGADLIYFGGIYPEAGLIVRQARQIGLDCVFMSGDGTIDPRFIEIAGAKAAEGSYLTFTPDPENLPSAREFIKEYRRRFGELGPYSIYSYAAIDIMLTAIEKAGSTDGAAIAETLHNTTFDSVLGKIGFTPKGDVDRISYVIWRVENGRFVEYWKPEGMKDRMEKEESKPAE